MTHQLAFVKLGHAATVAKLTGLLHLQIAVVLCNLESGLVVALQTSTATLIQIELGLFALANPLLNTRFFVLTGLG